MPLPTLVIRIPRSPHLRPDQTAALVPLLQIAREAKQVHERAVAAVQQKKQLLADLQKTPEYRVGKERAVVDRSEALKREIKADQATEARALEVLRKANRVASDATRRAYHEREQELALMRLKTSREIVLGTLTQGDTE